MCVLEEDVALVRRLPFAGDVAVHLVQGGHELGEWVGRLAVFVGASGVGECPVCEAYAGEQLLVLTACVEGH